MPIRESNWTKTKSRKRPSSLNPVVLWCARGCYDRGRSRRICRSQRWRYDDPDVAEFDRSRQGQFDFHNGVYFPSKAYIDGVSPYGLSFRALPGYAAVASDVTLVLLLHAPLAVMPVRMAEIVYFVINCALLGCLGWYCVHWLPAQTRTRGC